MTVVIVTVVTVTVVTVTVVKFVTVVIVTIATVALVRFFFSQFEFSSFGTPQHLDNQPLSGQLFAILAMFFYSAWADQSQHLYENQWDHLFHDQITQDLCKGKFLIM